MKLLTLFLVIIFSLGLVGCTNDEKIDDFLTEWDAMTVEIAKKIEIGDADGAKTVFDTKKDGLKSKYDSVKRTAASEGIAQKMRSSAAKNLDMLNDAMVKGILAKPSQSGKMQTLIREYKDFF
jgi:hypothetical protein